MAIYHCSVKAIGRSGGRSAVASIAYRMGERIEDQRQGVTWDYTRRQGVEHTETITPAGAEWAQDRARLWNAVELHDSRKNARLGTELELALPHELTPEQRLQLVRGFARELADRHAVAVDFAIHAPDVRRLAATGTDSVTIPGGDPRNHHVHLATTHRVVTADGMGAYAKPFDTPAKVEAVRELWGQHANRALEQAGRGERVDHRSYERQGVQQVPGVHLGPNVAAMERKGIGTDRGDEFRRTHDLAQRVREVSADIIDLKAERERRQTQESQHERHSARQHDAARPDREAHIRADGLARPAEGAGQARRAGEAAQGAGREVGADRTRAAERYQRPVQPGEPERRRLDQAGADRLDGRRLERALEGWGDPRLERELERQQRQAASHRLGGEGRDRLGGAAEARDHALRQGAHGAGAGVSWDERMGALGRAATALRSDGGDREVREVGGAERPLDQRPAAEHRAAEGARPETVTALHRKAQATVRDGRPIDDQIAAYGAALARAGELSQRHSATEETARAYTRREVGCGAKFEAANRAEQQFERGLAAAYRDPAAAKEAWKGLVKEHGLRDAMRAVRRDPAALGELQGWRFLVFHSKQRAAAENAARELPRLGADYRTSIGKAAAARGELRQMKAEKAADPVMKERAAIWRELEGFDSMKVRGELRQVIKDHTQSIAQRHAQHIERVGSTKELRFGEGARLKPDEARLIQAHPDLAKSAMMDAIKTAKPDLHKALTQGRSLGLRL